jgi:hypothetical protein
LIDDRLVSTMGYPSREALSALLNNATANVLPLQTVNDSQAASAKQGVSLPVSSLPVSSLPVSTLPRSKPAAEGDATGGGCCGSME